MRMRIFMSFFASADVCMFVARTGQRPINVHLFHLPSSLDFEVSLGFGSPEKEVFIFCVPYFSLRRLRHLHSHHHHDSNECGEQNNGQNNRHYN